MARPESQADGPAAPPRAATATLRRYPASGLNGNARTSAGSTGASRPAPEPALPERAREENPMKKLHTSLLVAIAAALPLSAAFAAEGADAKFRKMDADSNGQVSQSESRAAGDEMFTELDSDRDGNVTSAEIDAWKASKGKDHDDGMSAADMIEKVDTDGDSRISRQEHTAAGEKMFTESDANGDGNIDMAEFEAAKDRKHDDH
jgi:hypothetical protein